MPLFRYKELTTKKRNTSYHYIDADDLAAAKKKLHELKIIAAEIQSYDGFRKKFAISSKHLLMITKDFYYLLHSGLPLYESLLTLEEKYRGHKVYPMILDLSDNVKYGTKLSTILHQYKRAFSSIYCSMIRSAENSGNLSKAF
ncbi:type II secretion system F family protein, partial [bacterium]|nr:type II secretion system F family protein [bacterium]